VAPDRLLAMYLGSSNPLADAEAWTRPIHAALDEVSLEEHLKSLGATAAALRLMDVAPNCPGLAKASALWGLRDAQRRAAAIGGVPLEFPHGSAAFIEKLKGALRAPVHTGHAVTRIATSSDGVAVECADGSVHKADHAICTLPLPALARVAVAPPFEGERAAAVREIAHTPITRVYFSVRRPFWEGDGLPVSMWTDSLLERVFPIRDASGRIVALVSHVDGPNAEALDAMDDDERHRFAEQELARLRPATKGAVEAVRTHSWAKDPFSGGAYLYYAPGQITRFRAPVARPWGRLHFAGEHTAVTSPGIEGAAESADRAVAEILGETAEPARPIRSVRQA
jgi:monoamine oxidase